LANPEEQGMKEGSTGQGWQATTVRDNAYIRPSTGGVYSGGITRELDNPDKYNSVVHNQLRIHGGFIYHTYIYTTLIVFLILAWTIQLYRSHFSLPVFLYSYDTVKFIIHISFNKEFNFSETIYVFITE
jgi:hypothetical protein